ncbi:MAG: type VI secretion system tube protein Hcp [Nitrosarchaeum sp.]|nr:type VI secretion system tube protein Hcp [Nitrosarchaeum sp.]
MIKNILLLGITAVFAIGLLTQSASAASVDYFLKIDGVPGESTDDKHKGWIEIESFSWGASQSSATSGGGGAGKVSISDFSFTSSASKASPKLFEHVVTGKHIKDVTLQLCVAGEGRESQCYLDIVLSDVLVSSYQSQGSSGEQPTEQLSLNFSKIEFKYQPIGSSEAPVKAGYDLKKNVKV